MIRKYMVTTTGDRQIVEAHNIDGAIHNYERDSNNEDEITGVCLFVEPPAPISPVVKEEEIEALKLKLEDSYAEYETLLYQSDEKSKELNEALFLLSKSVRVINHLAVKYPGELLEDNLTLLTHSKNIILKHKN